MMLSEKIYSWHSVQRLKEKTTYKIKRKKDYEGDREWERDRERIIKIKCQHTNRNDEK